MSSKKQIQQLVSILAATNMLNTGVNKNKQFTEESYKQLKELPMQKGFESQPKNKGLKEFNINGKIIWALNYKNAVRKADKL